MMAKLSRKINFCRPDVLAFFRCGSSMGGDWWAVVWPVAAKGGAVIGAGSAGSGACGVADAPPPSVADELSTGVGSTMTGKRQDSSVAGVPCGASARMQEERIMGADNDRVDSTHHLVETISDKTIGLPNWRGNMIPFFDQ
jgi:hypothetical protein